MTPYFAYGSNLWEAQMKRRCPDSIKLGRGKLPHYKWIIYARGYANIIPSTGDSVEGVVYLLSPADEAALDQWEGVAKGLYAKEYLDVMTTTGPMTCLVYRDPDGKEGPPKQEYITRINNGLKDARLPDDYVSRYIRPFIPES